MTLKPLTMTEGIQRGREDREANMPYDPCRWVLSWALRFYRFEKGYSKGFYGN